MSVNERQLLCIFLFFGLYYTITTTVHQVLFTGSVSCVSFCINLTCDRKSHSKFHDKMWYEDAEYSSVPACFACQTEKMIELAQCKVYIQLPLKQ
jgi:hypothetical protein